MTSLDNYLDLDDPSKLNSVMEYLDAVLKKLSDSGKKITFKHRTEIMCWILNLYKDEKNIDVIKYTFKNNRTKKAMNFEKMEYGYEYNEVQVCVTNNSSIFEKILLGGIKYV